MNEEMTDRERAIVCLLVSMFLLAISVAILSDAYRNTVFFEDGSFIMQNGWSGCLPWAICAVGG